MENRDKSQDFKQDNNGNEPVKGDLQSNPINDMQTDLQNSKHNFFEDNFRTNKFDFIHEKMHHPDLSHENFHSNVSDFTHENLQSNDSDLIHARLQNYDSDLSHENLQIKNSESTHDNLQSNNLKTNQDELHNDGEAPVQEDLTEEQPSNKKSKKGLVGVGGAILVILSKFKSLIILLKLGKFGSTLISMFFMIWVYAKLYGVAYGVGFVVLLFVHEMGHYIAAKMVKLDVSVPLFIPFFGALISMKEMPRNAEVEAKVGLGGPILGSFAALLCMLLYFPLKEDFLLALAYTGFMLNLFNLIPVQPLDGGRAVAAISPWLWVIGLPIAVMFIFKFSNPVLVVILVLGVIEVINKFKNPDKEYFTVKPIKRVAFAIIYFGLLSLLGLGMAYIHGIHVNLIA